MKFNWIFVDPCYSCTFHICILIFHRAQLIPDSGELLPQMHTHIVICDCRVNHFFRCKLSPKWGTQTEGATKLSRPITKLQKNEPEYTHRSSNQFRSLFFGSGTHFFFVLRNLPFARYSTSVLKYIVFS
jgi:hypothetical protein